MNTTSIHEFEHVTDALGIDVKELGCVMLPVEPFDVLASREGLISSDDLYVSPDPKKFWVKGDVATAGGHVSLLYGLLEPAWKIECEVRDVMQGWSRPPVVVAESVEVFPSPYPDEPYGCVVARLRVSDELADAHARLSYLPHVNTFPGYKPHVTLAYVRAERAQDWADILSLDALSFETGSELDLGKRSGE